MIVFCFILILGAFAYSVENHGVIEAAATTCVFLLAFISVYFFKIFTEILTIMERQESQLTAIETKIKEKDVCGYTDFWLEKISNQLKKFNSKK